MQRYAVVVVVIACVHEVFVNLDADTVPVGNHSLTSTIFVRLARSPLSDASHDEGCSTMSGVIMCEVSHDGIRVMRVVPL